MGHLTRFCSKFHINVDEFKFSGSHAPAWERILDAPTSRGRKPTKTGRGPNRFPRRRAHRYT
jgi:hypothetical protein